MNIADSYQLWTMRPELLWPPSSEAPVRAPSFLSRLTTFFSSRAESLGRSVVLHSVLPTSRLEMNDKVEHDDAATIRAVLSGEHDQFRELVAKYQQQVFSLIVRQVRDRAVAEDLAQETFLKAFQNLKRFRGEARFSTWLIRIALNHTTNYFSSKRFKQMRRTDLLMPAHHPVSSESDSAYRDMIEPFQRALGDLSPKLREVIALCGLEEKSYEEAAEVLQIPVGTVKSRLNTARLKLKESLSQFREGGRDE